MEELYILCKYCDFFVDTGWPGLDERSYLHLEDGFYHPALKHKPTPSKLKFTLGVWKSLCPTLFSVYKDGRRGPNSVYYERMNRKLLKESKC